MNSAEEIVRWLSPVLQLVSIGLLLRWPKVKGWGPLMGSVVLSFIAALGWRLVRSHLEDGSGHLIVSNERSRAILDTWTVIERSLYFQGEVLFLGFVAAVALRHGLEANRNAVGASYPTNSPTFECSKCHGHNALGRTRCEKCGRSLLPLPLAIITLLGSIINFAIILVSCYWIPRISELFLTSAHSSSSFVNFTLPILIAGLLIVPPSGIILVILAARQGRDWARKFLQWFFGLNIIPIAFLAPEKGGIAWALLAGVTVIASLLIAYLGTSRVRQFCSVGSMSSARQFSRDAHP